MCCLQCLLSQSSWSVTSQFKGVYPSTVSHKETLMSVRVTSRPVDHCHENTVHAVDTTLRRLHNHYLCNCVVSSTALVCLKHKKTLYQTILFPLKSPGLTGFRINKHVFRVMSLYYTLNHKRLGIMHILGIFLE